MTPMMRRRTQGRGCPSRHGYGKCEMSDEAELIDRAWEKRQWRHEVAEERTFSEAARQKEATSAS